MFLVPKRSAEKNVVSPLYIDIDMINL